MAPRGRHRRDTCFTTASVNPPLGRLVLFHCPSPRRRDAVGDDTAALTLPCPAASIPTGFRDLRSVLARESRRGAGCVRLESSTILHSDPGVFGRRRSRHIRGVVLVPSGGAPLRRRRTSWGTAPSRVQPVNIRTARPTELSAVTSSPIGAAGNSLAVILTSAQLSSGGHSINSNDSRVSRHRRGLTAVTAPRFQERSGATSVIDGVLRRSLERSAAVPRAGMRRLQALIPPGEFVIALRRHSRGLPSIRRARERPP